MFPDWDFHQVFGGWEAVPKGTPVIRSTDLDGIIEKLRGAGDTMNKLVYTAVAAAIAGAALLAGGYALHGTTIVTRTVTHTVTRTVTHMVPVTRWKTRTVTSVQTVATGIPALCGQQLWTAWANRAPVAADMMNVAPSAVPACMPYIGQIAP